MNGIENRLDHCTVSVSPPLNPDHESVEVPDDLLRSLKITGTVCSYHLPSILFGEVFFELHVYKPIFIFLLRLLLKEPNFLELK